jgi:hypothetical protein
MGRNSHHGHNDDRYVTGGTNWDSYELPQLIAMVTEKVDIPALVRLADDWRYAGDDVTESAKDLAGALDRLMDFWSGEAAEQARTDVALNAQWVGDLGTTAHQIGAPIDEAAGALKAAQDAMPDLPPVTPAAGSAPDGAANAGAAGGPLGAAIGGVAAGSESAAEAAEQQAKLKLQAVETMKRFENAAMSIDQSIPRFEGPDTVIHKPAPEQPVKLTPPPSTAIGDANTTKTWQQLTGGHTTGTSAADFGGTGGHSSVNAPQHGAPVAGGVKPAPLPAAGAVAGVMPPAPVERIGTLPTAAALPVEMEGHPGMGGAPMGGPMGAASGGGAGNDHRRRFPIEEDDDPFSSGQKASPPVIGL